MAFDFKGLEHLPELKKPLDDYPIVVEAGILHSTSRDNLSLYVAGITILSDGTIELVANTEKLGDDTIHLSQIYVNNYDGYSPTPQGSI